MPPDPSNPPLRPDPTDIEATPAKLRNPDLAPGALDGAVGRRAVGRPGAKTPDNNYASNGHWDRDDVGPVSYVPPVEAHEDEGPVTGGAEQAPAQQGGPAMPGPTSRKDGR